MGEVVDEAFIQDPEHRPKLTLTEAEGIPLIDLSAATIDYSQASIEELVREIGRACEEWGFFQVINHGVPLEMRRKMESVARKFFAQPLEDKRKVKREEGSLLGYFDAENTKDVRDWKEVLDVTVEEATLVPASPDPQESSSL